jgi:hypothetical protein
MHNSTLEEANAVQMWVAAYLRLATIGPWVRSHEPSSQNPMLYILDRCVLWLKTFGRLLHSRELSLKRRAATCRLTCLNVRDVLHHVL